MAAILLCVVILQDGEMDEEEEDEEEEEMEIGSSDSDSEDGKFSADVIFVL